jgi:hypothetical protein
MGGGQKRGQYSGTRPRIRIGGCLLVLDKGEKGLLFLFSERSESQSFVQV